MPTFNVELSSKPVSSGEYKGFWHVFIRVSQYDGGKTTHERHGTNVYVQKADFNKKARFGKWIKANVNLNDKIEAAFMSVKAAHGIETDKPYLFIPFAEQWLRDVKKGMRPGTYRVHESFISSFKKVLAPNLQFTHINEIFVNNFVSKLRESGNGEGTIRDKFVTFKKVLKAAGHGDKIHLFEAVKIKYKPGKRDRLSPEEITLFETTDKITKLQRQAVDVFLFCFYNLGMRCGDALKMKVGDIRNKELTYLTRKTSHPFTIKMIPQAERMFEKYAKGKKPKEYLFPFMNQEHHIKEEHPKIVHNICLIDQRLHKVCKTLGIQKRITSHCARHTWASMADKKGIDRRIIQKALGHESLGTTEKYLDELSSEQVDNANWSLLA